MPCKSTAYFLGASLIASSVILAVIWSTLVEDPATVLLAASFDTASSIFALFSLGKETTSMTTLSEAEPSREFDGLSMEIFVVCRGFGVRPGPFLPAWPSSSEDGLRLRFCLGDSNKFEIGSFLTLPPILFSPFVIASKIFPDMESDKDFSFNHDFRRNKGQSLFLLFLMEEVTQNTEGYKAVSFPAVLNELQDLQSLFLLYSMKHTFCRLFSCDFEIHNKNRLL